MSDEDRGIPPMTSGRTRVPTSREFGRELREREEEEEAWGGLERVVAVKIPQMEAISSSCTHHTCHTCHTCT